MQRKIKFCSNKYQFKLSLVNKIKSVNLSLFTQIEIDLFMRIYVFYIHISADTIKH